MTLDDPLVRGGSDDRIGSMRIGQQCPRCKSATVVDHCHPNERSKPTCIAGRLMCRKPGGCGAVFDTMQNRWIDG